MPPDGSPQPTADEVAAATTWLNERLAAIAMSRPRDPGRVTIRRLNRTEYNNTIRDLVGVDFIRLLIFPATTSGTASTISAMCSRCRRC